ncbi:hypothetical protein [Halalkalicoccus sp. NIPERK01]|uniref:hypothetical protein n=1 Tax=Halalkalicoccus sp. NIPERK01 TaxID=3053469 RepID=UPI00256F20BC|nr:hypothetical protein [Halalkalicoccus sp. NIPERK01]MDL5362944.1 hypothetical protein [Halalkalicoccus sp. NIPERK01]
MFSRRSESGDVDPESRYGEPQHEATAGNAWEFECYGESDRVEPEPIEFVPEVEYRGEFEGVREGAGPKRPVGPLSVSD